MSLEVVAREMKWGIKIAEMGIVPKEKKVEDFPRFLTQSLIVWKCYAMQ